MNKPPKRLLDQVRELCASNERSEPRIERDKCAVKDMALFDHITSWGYTVGLEKLINFRLILGRYKKMLDNAHKNS